MLAELHNCGAWAGTAQCMRSLRMPKTFGRFWSVASFCRPNCLVELSIRGILRGYGLKVGEVSRGRFEARIRELIEGHEMLGTVIGAMLQARVHCGTSLPGCIARC